MADMYAGPYNAAGGQPAQLSQHSARNSAPSATRFDQEMAEMQAKNPKRVQPSDEEVAARMQEHTEHNASAPLSAVQRAILELQKEAAQAVLLEAQDKAKLHSQKDGDKLKHIGSRAPNAHLTLAAERANAQGTNLVNVLIKHAPENRTRVEKQLTGLLSHKGYGRTRALGQTRADVESAITRAFSG